MAPTGLELTFHAYLHVAEKSGRMHLRVRQNIYGSDTVKERMYHVGSPAYWNQDLLEWDYPLTPAAVIELDRVSREVGAAISWDPQLKEMADSNVALDTYEEQVRLSLERALRNKEPLPEYPTNTFGGTKPAMYHQSVSYHWALRTSGLLLAHEPGCIAGDQTIEIKRHGRVFPIRLRDLYAKFNNIPGTPHGWAKQGGITTKSLFPDGILRHNTIQSVVYRGEKAVYRVRLASGKALRCTADHELSQPGGQWTPLCFLRPGDRIHTNGVVVRVCPECGPSEKIIRGTNATFRGFRYRGAHRGDRNGRRINGLRIDEDGSVLVSNQYKRPYRNRYHCVREHVLVMETHLGRHLEPHEGVRHKEGNKQNTSINNLELMTLSEHARHHAAESPSLHMDGGAAEKSGLLVRIPQVDQIVSIEADGETDTYDLVMEDPARNFVANGVIVHNCGKTRSAADAAGGWYREGIIRPMKQVWRPTAKVGTQVGLWGVEGGVLVVCPKVMMRTWRMELFQWQGMIGLEISGRRRSCKLRAAGTLAHVHIINYEMLSLLIDMHNEYDAIIVDESHKCANRSNQTMNVLNLSLQAKRKLLLTGTPVTNDLKSVFFQMLICDGGRSLGPSESRFLERYFTSEQTRNGTTTYTPRPGAIEAVSAAMAKHTYFLKKTDVLDLPNKTHTPIFLDMTADQARYYEQVRTETISYIQDKEVTAEMAATRMMKLAQICQGFVLTDDGEARHFTNAKQEALMSLLLDTYRHRKVVIWARFTYEIQMLCQMLHDAGITFVKLAGDVKQGQRHSIIEAWQTRPDIKVFVGQLQLGIGITLHAAECDIPCSDMIYLGLDFSFINWKQTQDRIHRIGQRDACNYQYLLTEKGIDHRMYRALLAKEETAEAVHKQGKDFYLSLLKDDTPALAAID